MHDNCLYFINRNKSDIASQLKHLYRRITEIISFEAMNLE